MSGKYDVDAQIAALQRWVGFHEGPNNANPFSVWQGYGTTHLPWCGSFANFCACEAGDFVWPSYCQFGAKGDGYVPFSEQHARSMGIWRSTGTRAKRGWQVIYDWERNGVADHIETVLSDNGNEFVTIGGNTGDAVMYRKRNRAFVRGFIALDAAGQNVPAHTSKPLEKEQDMVTVIPAKAKAVGGRIPFFVLSGGHVLAYNKAHLKWRGGDTKHTQFGQAEAYNIPIRAPFLGMAESLNDRGQPDNVLVVVAGDGGCAFADILLPK